MKTCIFLLLAICSATGSAQPAPVAETTVPATAEEGPSRPPEIDGTIGLRRALALALKHNPALQAYAWDIRAAEARKIQAGLYPNPTAGLEVEGLRLSPGPSPRTSTRSGSLGISSEGLGPPGFNIEREMEEGAPSGLGNAEITVNFSQVVLLAGKRVKEVRLREYEIDVARWDYEVARADVLARTAQAFYNVLEAQERVAVHEEIVHLAREVADSVAKRVDAGRDSPIQARRARIELSSAEIDLDRARHQLNAAKAQLAAAWGAEDVTFAQVIGNWNKAEELPPLEGLRKRVSENPDVQRWAAELERRDAATVLAQANAWPDLELRVGLSTRGLKSSKAKSFGLGSDGASYTHRESSFESSREYALQFEASIPVPIFDRNQGAILESEHLRSKGDDERRATRVDVSSALRQAHEHTSAAYHELQMLEEQVIPNGERNLSDIQIGYRAGKFDLLDVLDAERTLFNLRIQSLQALAVYHQGVISIERLTGALSASAQSGQEESKDH